MEGINKVGTARPESCRISILFFPYNDFPVFIYPVSSSTLRGSGCEATVGASKNLPPETSKVKPPTKHKKVNVMKKRTEIQQDLKRGFGSIPIGIKILVKWLLVGFVAYVAVRFVCAFVGGMVTSLGGILPTLAVLAVVVFLIRLSMAHLFHCPYPFSFFSFSSSFFA